MKFKDKLHMYRMQRGLTMEELAALTGLSQQAISMYETGKRKSPLPVAKNSLARALKIKPELLDDDKEENK